MTERQIRRWLDRRKLQDEWWVCCAGLVCEIPVSLDEIRRRNRANSEVLQILHISQTDSPQPDWVVVDAPPAMILEELLDYTYLKGRKPTPKQTKHLRKDLFYEGVEPYDAYEACQLIGYLHHDPATEAKREIEAKKSLVLAEEAQNQRLAAAPEIRADLKKKIQDVKSLLKKTTDEQEREELEDHLAGFEDDLLCLADELKWHKEEQRENALMAKEDARERMREFQWEMGPEGFWGDLIRKPTLAQVKLCVEELDRDNFEWEDETASLLYALLCSKFPDLRKT